MLSRSKNIIVMNKIQLLIETQLFSHVLRLSSESNASFWRQNRVIDFRQTVAASRYLSFVVGSKVEFDSYSYTNTDEISLKHHCGFLNTSHVVKA